MNQSADCPESSASEELYGEKSCLVFDLNSKCRKLAIAIMQARWFERLSMCVIVANCVALGSADPCDSLCRSPTCQIVQIVELLIFVFFALEMTLKMVAMGVWGDMSYLAEPWNRLDCFIVVAGSVEYAFASNSDVNLSAIRAFRVLRPLRAINRISSLRLLVNLLLDILPMLGHVMILCFFIFFIFGAISVQLWSGVLRHRCFFANDLSPKPPPLMPPFYQNSQDDFVCSPTGSGMFRCSDIAELEKHSSVCSDLFNHDLTKIDVCKRWVLNYTDCRPEGPNPARGTVSFDHFGYASIAIFQVISLEGWTRVMYYVQDSYSVWAWVYFLILVMLGSYLAVNLCLVVIAAQFSVTKMREKVKMRRERLEQARSQGLSLTSLTLSNVGSSIGESAGLYIQVLNLIIHYLRKTKRWLKQRMRAGSAQKSIDEPSNSLYRQRSGSNTSQRTTRSSTICQKCRSAPASSYRPLDKPFVANRQVSFPNELGIPMQMMLNRCQLCGEPLDPPNSRAESVDRVDTGPATELALEEVTIRVRRSTVYWTNLEQLRRFRHTSRAWLKRAIDSKYVTIFIMTTVTLNAAVMAVEHHDQPAELTRFVEVSNLVFTVIFTVELCIKFYAHRAEEFFREAFNTFDALIAIVNLVDLLTSGQGSGVAVLRLFRLVRIVKLVRFLPALQRQLLIMINTIDHVATFFLLLTFFLFISALLGMSLFGCKFCMIFTARENVDELVSDLDPMQLSKCRFVVKPLLDETEKIVRNATNSSSFESADELLECPVANFDNLGQALFTVLQIFTQDDWGAIMRNGMHATSDLAGLYFIALVTLGNYIIFNLLVAILVEGFSSKSEEAILKANKIALVNEHPAVQSAIPTSEKSFHLSMEEKVQVASSNSCSDTLKRKFNKLKSQFLAVWDSEEQDFSLLIFRWDNKLRMALKRIFSSPIYEQLLLGLIIVNCGVIAFENPRINKQSWERHALNAANYVISLAFVAESLGKIIACGFIFGRNAYLKSGWNCLDFFLVSISAADFTLDFLDPNSTNRKVLQVLRVLRLLRALRPLRMISKARGLKIVIETLAMSIKPIGNIILICCFFFVIFAILGVQIFRGCYSRCVAAKVQQAADNGQNMTTESYVKWAMETISIVSNKTECEAFGLEWETESYNFDSLPEALMALFVFSTLDGWADISRNGIACVGVDQQPIPNHNPWNFTYFAAFMLVVCFFALNMFVGVVVNNFQKVQRRFEAEMLAQIEQSEIEKRKNSKIFKRIYRRMSMATATVIPTIPRCFGVRFNIEPQQQQVKQRPSTVKQRLRKQKAVDSSAMGFMLREENAEHQPFWLDYPSWRQVLYHFVEHRYFDVVMTGATTINVVTMAIEYYNMPPVLSLSIKIMGLAFLGLIVLETLLKLAAYGPKRYIADKWNRLDLTILISSIVATLLEELNSDHLPINPSLIRIARIFRIFRILKLWRAATGVRKLLKTISQAIPQCGNLSVLFLLLFFIYASLGVELYGRFNCDYEECDGLSRHANFDNFGTALLTLFRIFTGDDWNGILKDILRLSSTDQACLVNQSKDANENGISCSIIHSISPFYFVSFVLLAQFVLINVVVAVLMRQIEDAHKEPPAPANPPSCNAEINQKTAAGRRRRLRRGDKEPPPVKETCFIDGVDFATVHHVRHPASSLEMYDDDYMIDQLKKIAEGVQEDDANEDEERFARAYRAYQRHSSAAALNEQQRAHLQNYVVVNEQQQDVASDADDSYSFTSASSNNCCVVDYDAIAETRRAMDAQLLRRLANNSIHSLKDHADKQEQGENSVIGTMPKFLGASAMGFIKTLTMTTQPKQESAATPAAGLPPKGPISPNKRYIRNATANRKTKLASNSAPLYFGPRNSMDAISE